MENSQRMNESSDQTMFCFCFFIFISEKVEGERNEEKGAEIGKSSNRENRVAIRMIMEDGKGVC